MNIHLVICKTGWCKTGLSEQGYGSYMVHAWCTLRLCALLPSWYVGWYTLLSMTVMVTPCLWYVVGMKLVCPMSNLKPLLHAPLLANADSSSSSLSFHRVLEGTPPVRQQVPNPTPLNPTAATCHIVKRKRKLRCNFWNVVLQKLHCNIRFSAVRISFWPKAALQHTKKRHCNIEERRCRKVALFLPLSCGFQAPTLRHPHLGPAEFGAPESYCHVCCASPSNVLSHM